MAVNGPGAGRRPLAMTVPRGATLRDQGLEPPHELVERHPDLLTDAAQLDQIEASLARLVFADERLWLPQPLGQVHLAQPGVDPDLTQERLQRCALLGGAAWDHDLC